MADKVELIELYLPECMVEWANRDQDLEKLAGFKFFKNYGTQDQNRRNFDEMLNHYFFDNVTQFIPHGALCAYFCDLHPNQLYWIKADPVQYVLDMSKGFIVPGEFEFVNVAKYNTVVNQFLSDDNLKFQIIDKQNALINSQKPIDYRAPTLVNIINQPISFDQISGKDKVYFQKLSAELQLLFRQHKTVEHDPDGVYLGGAGELPDNKPQPKFTKIISNHYSALGLAKLAEVNFEKWDSSKNFNFGLIKEKAILIMTEDFSLQWRSGNSLEFINLAIYFDKVLLELISLVKNNKLNKIILNTGDETYQLTKGNIIKSYFTRFFK